MKIKLFVIVTLCSGLISCAVKNGNVTGSNIQINGTIVWMSIEGGFWAIRGNDNKTYEPINLPSEFEQDGLAVIVDAKIREDLGSFRMVGPVIEIKSIKRQ